MQLLANENIPKASITELRRAGHDVIAIIEVSPGVSDEQVLNRANREQRLILTCDRDYGDLIYRRSLPPPPGILYVRFAPDSPIEIAEHLLLLFARTDIALRGHFNVLDRAALRQRPLPI